MDDSAAFRCSCGAWSALRELYFCPQCRAPKCTSLECVVEELWASMCPQCLTVLAGPDAVAQQHQCKECRLCPKCGSVCGVHEALPEAQPDARARFFFRCSYAQCAWTSASIGLSAPSVEDLAAAAASQEALLGGVNPVDQAAAAFAQLEQLLEPGRERVAALRRRGVQAAHRRYATDSAFRPASASTPGTASLRSRAAGAEQAAGGPAPLAAPLPPRPEPLPTGKWGWREAEQAEATRQSAWASSGAGAPGTDGLPSPGAAVPAVQLSAEQPGSSPRPLWRGRPVADDDGDAPAVRRALDAAGRWERTCAASMERCAWVDSAAAGSFPLRVPLTSLPLRRCRTCHAAGLPAILRQPELAALAGAAAGGSSGSGGGGATRMRAAAWFKKLEAAPAYIPWLWGGLAAQRAGGGGDECPPGADALVVRPGQAADVVLCFRSPADVPSSRLQGAVTCCVRAARVVAASDARGTVVPALHLAITDAPFDVPPADAAEAGSAPRPASVSLKQPGVVAVTGQLRADEGAPATLHGLWIRLDLDVTMRRPVRRSGAVGATPTPTPTPLGAGGATASATARIQVALPLLASAGDEASAGPLVVPQWLDSDPAGGDAGDSSGGGGAASSGSFGPSGDAVIDIRCA